MKPVINKLAKKIFNHNVTAGWWDNMDRCLFQTLQLVSTEIAEATEGERKDLMDDKLPHRKMGEVELADAMIRLLDLAGRYDWKYRVNVGSGITDYLNEYRDAGAASMHFCLTIQLARLGMNAHQFGTSNKTVEICYCTLVDMIQRCADYLGYDLWGALDEKFEYNKTRKDHTREARAAVGGKKI